MKVTTSKSKNAESFVSVKLSTHRAKVIELELIILILRLFIFTTLRNLI